MNDSTEKSLLEFPCEFPIKIMGHARDDFESLVVALVRQHVPDLGEAAIRSRPRQQGKYLQVTVSVNATTREQIDGIS